MRAGFAPSDIVFSGVGKSPDEIDRAVQLGLKAINAESAGELERIDRAAQARGVRAQGGRARQSRYRRRHAPPHFDRTAHQQVRRSARAGARPVSQDGGAAGAAAGRHPRAPRLADHQHGAASARGGRGGPAGARAAGSGIQLDHIDIGGGLGISYDGSRAPTAAEYAAAILPIVAPSGLSIALEPGRYHRRRRGGAACARGRPEGCRRRASFRGARRRHDRADAADALRRLPPHRRRHAARGPRRLATTSSDRCARAPTRSAAIGA